MPLYLFRCPECGAARERFYHVAEDKGCDVVLCACGSTMGPVLSVGQGLTYFEEGRGQWIRNLGHEPIYVTSHAQHQKAMRQAGVDWATKWPRQKTGGWV